MFTVLPESDVALIDDVIPQVTETVTVRRTDHKDDDFGWDVDELLGYVAGQIQQLHGPFPRNPKKEAATMRSFIGRWGEQAGPIARYAFEVSHGMWRNAPVGITRFCQACDPYFAEVIAKEL